MTPLLPCQGMDFLEGARLPAHFRVPTLCAYNKPGTDSVFGTESVSGCSRPGCYHEQGVAWQSLTRVTFLAKGEEAPSSSISIKRHKTGFPNEFLTFLRIEDVVDEIENLPGRPTLGEHEQRPRNRELAA